jgi:hypothetical protein
LQPGTLYHYRLTAVNETGQTAVDQAGEPVLPEGVFTTAPAPFPQAITGGAAMIGATSALVSGSAGPEGQPATYAFELGVYAGQGTQFGTAFKGSVSASAALIQESLGLSGLQPGTTYAYRITVSSGYGQATGATQTFTTDGLPAVLAVPATLPLLAVPAIVFPAEIKVSTTTKTTTPKKCAKHKKLSHGRCIKAKTKKTKKAKKSSTKEM